MLPALWRPVHHIFDIHLHLNALSKSDLDQEILFLIIHQVSFQVLQEVRGPRFEWPWTQVTRLPSEESSHVLLNWRYPLEVTWRYTCTWSPDLTFAPEFCQRCEIDGRWKNSLWLSPYTNTEQNRQKCVCASYGYVYHVYHVAICILIFILHSHFQRQTLERDSLPLSISVSRRLPNQKTKTNTKKDKDRDKDKDKDKNKYKPLNETSLPLSISVSRRLPKSCNDKAMAKTKTKETNTETMTETKTKTNPWTGLSASLHLCVKETSKHCHLRLDPSSPPCEIATVSWIFVFVS